MWTKSGYVLLVYPIIAAFNWLFVIKFLSFRQLHRRLTLPICTSLTSLGPSLGTRPSNILSTSTSTVFSAALKGKTGRNMSVPVLSVKENACSFRPNKKGFDRLKISSSSGSKLALRKSENSFGAMDPNKLANTDRVTTEGEIQPLDPKLSISVSKPLLPSRIHSSSTCMSGFGVGDGESGNSVRKPTPAECCSNADRSAAEGGEGQRGERELERRDPYSIARILPCVFASNLLYAICFLPFFSYTVMDVLSKFSNKSSLYNVAVSIAYVHPVLNALMYVLGLAPLRKNLVALLATLVPSVLICRKNVQTKPLGKELSLQTFASVVATNVPGNEEVIQSEVKGQKIKTYSSINIKSMEK